MNKLMNRITLSFDSLASGGYVEAVDANRVDLENTAVHNFGVEPEVCTDNWYALYVRSRHEKTVEISLRSKGYNVFSPSYRTKRKRVDRIAEIEVALFPGYVFCQFDQNKRLPILITPGVVGVVGRGNRPEPVDDTEIDSIRTVALAGRSVQPWPFLKLGQRIRMQSGPLTGVEGIFLRVQDKDHLVVSVTLLQRAVSVVIERDSVSPVFSGERYTQSF